MLLALCLPTIAAAQVHEPAPDAAAVAFFLTEVRPLLSQRCFACHGPAVAKSDLRLDQRDSMLRGGRSAQPAIVPGDPDASLLLQRVRATDAEERMPPAGEHEPLSAEECEVLRRWIESGATYTQHWSFEPVRPPAPEFATCTTREAIDRILGKQLAAKELERSPAVAPSVWLRRAYLDLVGLPPTPDALQRFEDDTRADARERVVEELLASPHFGERMALPWLDVARYADTNGYSIDDHRDMWAWRDWVIDAFNQNMAYDRFVVQQLAGDLLPDADESSRLATGFLRNSPSTHEGGIIPEEYRVTYIADKIDAVATTFMGLTLRCAQCHDHKYDPLSQRDYYRMFAFFDRAVEPGVGGKNGNIAPSIDVRSPLLDDERMRSTARERIATLEHYRLHPPDLIDARAAWMLEQRRALPVETTSVAHVEIPQWIWGPADAQAVRFEKEIQSPADCTSITLQFRCDNRARIEWDGIEVARSEDWTAPQQIELALPRAATTARLVVHAENLGGPAGFVAAIEVRCPAGSQQIGTDTTWDCYRADAGEDAPAQSASRRVETRSLGAHGTAPWGQVLTLPDPEFYAALTAEKPTDAQWQILNAAHARVDARWSGHATALGAEIRALERQVETARVSTMVMAEGEERSTYVLQRGQYDQPDLDQLVQPGVPEAIFAWDRAWPSNRLGLATWLADPRHPLTARVAVNRVWQMIFGVGLVATANDFGSQGDVPVQRELLDFLAHRFVQSGWDLKALIREIVQTETYAQSAGSHPRGDALDPSNRLYWRAARRRLPAELLRDQALALGGLLVLDLGGPSVFPAQPLGLWQELSHFGHPEPFTAQAYYSGRSAERFRRSLYGFWKRSAPPPTLVAFDAPTRESCTAMRAETNTPLQALITLNGPEYVAAAEGFAMRAREVASSHGERLDWMFHAATARRPLPREREVLRACFEDARAQFANSATAHAGTPDQAALALVAATILNLDETLTQH